MVVNGELVFFSSQKDRARDSLLLLRSSFLLAILAAIYYSSCRVNTTADVDSFWNRCPGSSDGTFAYLS